MKLKKSHFMAIFIILVMVASVLGYAVIQAIPAIKTNEQEVKMPEENIIEYELSAEQKRYALLNGNVIIEFLFDPDVKCDNCEQLESFSRGMAEQFPDQVILSIMNVSSKDYVDLPRIEMTSARGSWSPVAENMTSNDLLDGFCELSSDPPIGCALRKV